MPYKYNDVAGRMPAALHQKIRLKIFRKLFSYKPHEKTTTVLLEGTPNNKLTIS